MSRPPPFTERLPRVVQIGFHKAGSRSFEQLFERAGHRVLKHKLRGPLWRSRNAALLMRQNLEAGRKIFAGMEDFTYYGDLIYQTPTDSFEPIFHFRDILRDYPDTILLLNLRDREDWIRSRLRHGHGEFAQRTMRQKGITSPEVLADLWRQDWDRHIADVRAYMAGRPEQLIEFDLDRDPISKLIARLPGYGLRPDDWADIGRTRGVQRHPLVAWLKRTWSHARPRRRH